jgi:hypothetical protein
MTNPGSDQSSPSCAAALPLAKQRAGIALLVTLIAAAALILGAGVGAAASPDAKTKTKSATQPGAQSSPQSGTRSRARSNARMLRESMMVPHGSVGFGSRKDTVNVSVNFSVQLPLKDMKEDTIKRQQESGRELFYRLTQTECKILLTTIAKTCRLSNLNVSTRMRERYNQPQPRLDVSGSARYLITLKGKKGAKNNKNK